MVLIQAKAASRVWIRERFDATRPIGDITAKSNLPRGASEESIQRMIAQLVRERNQVRSIIKMEIEKLMRFGADITQMSYNDRSTGSVLSCVNPKSIRESYLQDGGLENLKRLHWIFSELPFGTHQDVLPRRQTHQELVVARVVQAMQITWATKKEGETACHKNCIQHTYSKIMNDKRHTIIRSTSHGRQPMVRHPKTFEASGRAPNYKKGMKQFYWKSESEGVHVVRNIWGSGSLHYVTHY